MSFFVTKANGYKQEFDRSKVVATCLRLGASSEVAAEVAAKVEMRVYDGMPTKKILQLIFIFMRKYAPAIKDHVDLRRALSLMEPAPEFEFFIRSVLMNSGYEVEANRILRGKCGEHEVDAVARKDGITYFVETKHHYSYHALTGLDESRIARAILEDVTEGYPLGVTKVRIDRAMIITNTRYSSHAIQYGSCRDILQIGWRSPPTSGLRDLIEKGKLYPLSSLKGVKVDVRRRFVKEGIVLLKQLIDLDGIELAKKTGLKKELVQEIIKKACVKAKTLWKNPGKEK